MQVRHILTSSLLQTLSLHLEVQSMEPSRCQLGARASCIVDSQLASSLICRQGQRDFPMFTKAREVKWSRDGFFCFMETCDFENAIENRHYRQIPTRTYLPSGSAFFHIPSAILESSQYQHDRQLKTVKHKQRQHVVQSADVNHPAIPNHVPNDAQKGRGGRCIHATT